MKQSATIVLLALLFGACSSTKPPTQKLTQTEASIRQAEQVGAEEYAPLEIREARKKLEQSKDLVEDEKYEEAKRTADQAMVNAELAQIKSLSAKAQKAVYELKQSIQALQDEIQKNINSNQ